MKENTVLDGKERNSGDFPGCAKNSSEPYYTGPLARLLGYSAPTWNQRPQSATFNDPGPDPFPQSHDVMGDGRVLLLPTPGHTPGHQSVLVRQPAGDLLLTGNLTYSEQALLDGTFGGILPAPTLHRRSMQRVREYVRQSPTIYPPSHDPEPLVRLQRGLPTATSGGLTQSYGLPKNTLAP